MSVLLDRADLTGKLFFPSDRTSPAPRGAEDRFIDVPGAGLHLRMHPSSGAGVVLLFHGNGENVCDWDEAALTFAQHGARLLVVDYRGYGASTGVPTLRRVLDDAHLVLDAVRRWVSPQRIVLMGRSLGSAPAWDVAQSAPDLAGVVIDSGFTDVDAFSLRRGIEPASLPPDERLAIDPIPKIAASRAPLLLLHGEEDRAIAVREAEAALRASVATDKALVRLSGRGHNDLFMHPDYWRSLGGFLSLALR